MFRPRLRVPRIDLVRPKCQRQIHSMPRLPYNTTEGIGSLYSAGGFDLAWTQYQALTLGRLNHYINGTPHSDEAMKKIIEKTSREPSQAHIFNHASMAHNNHFFFEGLSPTKKDMPVSLQHNLEGSFGSIETLKREFIVTALAMFGPGFVWLVRVNDKATGKVYRLLPTYLAGTPYTTAHWRRQAVDMNTVGGASEIGQGAVRNFLDKTARAVSQNPTITGGRGAVGEEQKVAAPPGAPALVTPLLCLNTWEHAWLRDFGLEDSTGAGGKAHFAEVWWEHIDWDHVETRNQDYQKTVRQVMPIM